MSAYCLQRYLHKSHKSRHARNNDNWTHRWLICFSHSMKERREWSSNNTGKCYRGSVVEGRVWAPRAGPMASVSLPISSVTIVSSPSSCSPHALTGKLTKPFLGVRYFYTSVFYTLGGQVVSESRGPLWVESVTHLKASSVKTVALLKAKYFVKSVTDSKVRSVRTGSQTRDTLECQIRKTLESQISNTTESPIGKTLKSLIRSIPEIQIRSTLQSQIRNTLENQIRSTF